MLITDIPVAVVHFTLCLPLRHYVTRMNSSLLKIYKPQSCFVRLWRQSE